MYVNGEYVDDELIRVEASGIREQLRNQSSGYDDLQFAMGVRNQARENVIERVILRQGKAGLQDPVAESAGDQRLLRSTKCGVRLRKCYGKAESEK